MIYIITFLFGSLIGSFLNVCIYRIPRIHFTLTEKSFANLRLGKVPAAIFTKLEALKNQEYIGERAFFHGLENALGKDIVKQHEAEIFKHVSFKRESIVFPGSHCPNCHAPIKPWDNIPLLSFIILGGKCRSCHTKISLRYPLVELLTSVLFVLFVYQFSITVQTLIYLVFAAALIVISFIDLDHTIIPGVIARPGIVIGLTTAFVLPLKWYDAILGALIGGGAILFIVYVGPLIFKQEAMGRGDVELMAMIGAFLGWKLALLTIFFGSMIGAVVGTILIILKKTTLKSYIPFGPFLCMGALIALFLGEQLFLWYWNVFLPPL